MRTLLITATIKPLCNIQYSDVSVRLNEYMNNLRRYIKETDFDNIVFAENSGYQFDVKEIERLAKECNKYFEYLDVSEEAKSPNISIGDATIMKQALQTSSILRNSDYVWKVSGRIWISNVNNILRKTKLSKNGENTFLYSPRYNSIQTWFFEARVQDLLKFFLSDKALQEMRNSCIEYTWMDIYNHNGDNINMRRFKEYPNAIGTNSSGNKYTISKLGYWVKSFLLKMGYYTVRHNNRKH